jgi:hypothetical protein
LLAGLELWVWNRGHFQNEVRKTGMELFGLDTFFLHHLPRLLPSCWTTVSNLSNTTLKTENLNHAFATIPEGSPLEFVDLERFGFGLGQPSISRGA